MNPGAAPEALKDWLLQNLLVILLDVGLLDWLLLECQYSLVV